MILAMTNSKIDDEDAGVNALADWLLLPFMWPILIGTKT
jgi:hypothetical protein